MSDKETQYNKWFSDKVELSDKYTSFDELYDKYSSWCDEECIVREGKLDQKEIKSRLCNEQEKSEYGLYLGQNAKEPGLNGTKRKPLFNFKIKGNISSSDSLYKCCRAKISTVNVPKKEPHKKKKERKPTTKWTMEEVLQEQEYKCRGPIEGEYICPMNRSKMKFSDSYAPDAEYDHIITLESGGSNDINNIQALCGCCHNKKTKKESLIKNNETVSKRVTAIYSSLSKPKYQEESKTCDKEPYSESSDSETDDYPNRYWAQRGYHRHRNKKNIGRRVWYMDS